MKPLRVRIGAVLAALIVACGDSTSQQVVVYVSEDQVFSEPILADFEKETGIRVKAVFDTEEAKSTGVMNRLLAERGHPQADVYWANEPIRAELLKQKEITQPYVSPSAEGIPASFRDPEGHWTGFSARARVLVVHDRVLEKPASIAAYVDPAWKGKAVIANPLFGTTTTQFACIFELWGDATTKEFLERMKANDVRISTSNGDSTDLVASGQSAFALVDSDDGVSRIRQGRPIEMVYPDQGQDDPGCLVLPNVVLLVRGGPNPENGKRLMDFLLSRETERALAFADCSQIPLHEGVETPLEMRKIEQLKVMKIDYAAVARRMQEIQPFLKTWVED